MKHIVIVSLASACAPLAGCMSMGRTVTNTPEQQAQLCANALQRANDQRIDAEGRRFYLQTMREQGCPNVPTS